MSVEDKWTMIRQIVNGVMMKKEIRRKVLGYKDW